VDCRPSWSNIHRASYSKTIVQKIFRARTNLPWRLLLEDYSLGKKQQFRNNYNEFKVFAQYENHVKNNEPRFGKLRVSPQTLSICSETGNRKEHMKKMNFSNKN
jgi:hypothetical protein